MPPQNAKCTADWQINYRIPQRKWSMSQITNYKHQNKRKWSIAQSKWKTDCNFQLEDESDLGGNEREVSCEGTGLRAALAPVEEALGISGVARYAEGVDEGGGQDVLAEAIGAALTVEAGQDEADGGEVVVSALGAAEGVEELAKFGALNGRRLALLHPVEQAHHHTELCIRHC